MFRTAETPRKTSGIIEFPTALSSDAKKLYRKLANIPQKTTSRYSRMRPQTSSGTEMKRIIASIITNDRILSTAEKKAIITNEVNMFSLR